MDLINSWNVFCQNPGSGAAFSWSRPVSSECGGRATELGLTSRGWSEAGQSAASLREWGQAAEARRSRDVMWRLGAEHCLIRDSESRSGFYRTKMSRYSSYLGSSSYRSPYSETPSSSSSYSSYSYPEYGSKYDSLLARSSDGGASKTGAGNIVQRKKDKF